MFLFYHILVYDACVTPILTHEEVLDNDQHKSRNAFSKVNNLAIPNPAPKIYTVKEFENIRAKM